MRCVYQEAYCEYKKHSVRRDQLDFRLRNIDCKLVKEEENDTLGNESV